MYWSHDVEHTNTCIQLFLHVHGAVYMCMCPLCVIRLKWRRKERKKPTTKQQRQRRRYEYFVLNMNIAHSRTVRKSTTDWKLFRGSYSYQTAVEDVVIIIASECANNWAQVRAFGFFDEPKRMTKESENVHESIGTCMRVLTYERQNARDKNLCMGLFDKGRELLLLLLLISIHPHLFGGFNENLHALHV